MHKIKFLSALLILTIVFSCSKITEKVEQKVNEKVEQKIDESLKKIDTTFSKEKLDSLKKQLDSLSNVKPNSKGTPSDEKRGKKLN